METMLYTIDHINNAAREAEAILPEGVSLGAHVLDDCDTDTYGLEQAVEFIKGRRGPSWGLSSMTTPFVSFFFPLL